MKPSRFFSGRVCKPIILGLCGLGLLWVGQVQSNTSLTPYASYPAQGSSATGRIHSVRHNPAILLYLTRDHQPINLGFGQIHTYLELGSTNDLTRLAIDLQDDLAALQHLFDGDVGDFSDENPEIQRALTRLARWDDDCRVFLQDQQSRLLEKCIAGAADQIEFNLLGSLEKGGRFQAGLSTELPGFPIVGRWTPWMGWAAGLGVQKQIGGRFYGDSLRGQAILSVHHQQEELLSLTSRLSYDGLGLAFIQFQQLTQQYINRPESLVDPTAGAWSPEAVFLQQALDILTRMPESGEPLLSAAEATQLRLLVNRLSDPTDPLFMAALRGELEFTPDALMVTHSSIVTHAAEALHLYFATSVDASLWFDWPASWGQLDLGLRTNLYHLRLSTDLVSLNGLALSQDAQQVVDRVRSGFNADARDEWLVGVDAGVFWQLYPWQLGLTLFNLNQPVARYPRLSSREEGADQEAAEYLSALGRLMDQRVFSMRRHAVLEAAFFAFEPEWVLRGHYAMDTTENLVGWAERSYGLSLAWQTDARWVPGLRVGWRRNQTGSRLDTVHLGLSFTPQVQLDIASSLQPLDFGGRHLPRYFSLGLTMQKSL